MAVRFAFGDRLGGVFLAFPAILPASLTLIAGDDGKRKAEVDAAGAIIGGIALVAFGAVSSALLSSTPPRGPSRRVGLVDRRRGGAVPARAARGSGMMSE